jgi:predicted transcriptional regulator YdeE
MSKLTHSGTIALIHREGIISCRRYTNIAQRKEIMAFWQRMYGKKYSECDLSITPDICLSKLRKLDAKQFKTKAA